MAVYSLTYTEQQKRVVTVSRRVGAFDMIRATIKAMLTNLRVVGVDSGKSKSEAKCVISMSNAYSATITVEVKGQEC